MIASVVKQIKIKNTQTVISSGDKDLAQLVSKDVVLMNNFDSKILDTKGVIEKFGVSPEQIFDYLCLVGDTSDNIPGVPKVGPKTAVTLLTKYKNLAGVFQNTSQLKGKLKENIENSIETVELAKKLVALKSDLPLNLEESQLLIDKQDKASLEKIITKYELKSLSNQLKIKAIKKKVKKNYKLVSSMDQAKKIINECKKIKLFAFDTETTSLDFNEAELVGFSISYKHDHGFYFPLRHNCTPQSNLPFDETILILQELFKDKNITVIGQNFKYDINVMKKYAIEVLSSVEDTVLMSYVINSSGKHDLGTLSLVFLDHVVISYEDVV